MFDNKMRNGVRILSNKVQFYLQLHDYLLKSVCSDTTCSVPWSVHFDSFALQP